MENKYLEEAEKAQKIILEIEEGKGISPEFKTCFENNSKKIELLVERLNDKERSTLFRESYSNFNPNENIGRFRLKLAKQAEVKRRKTIYRVVASLSAAVIVFSLFIFNRATVETNNIVVENIVAEKISVPTLITQDSVIKIVGDNTKIIAAEYHKEDVKNISAKVVSNSLQRLIIPHGDTYTVILPDGTEVMLNAESELSYPAYFNKNNNREVILKGEAFFNVKKSDQPFIVKTHSGAQVKVYGTQFNVNTKRHNQVTTILVEGSVGFESNDGVEVKIKPNQMIVCNLVDNSNQVFDINPNDYLGWRKGLFDYHNGNFNAIMDEIASWYGVTFNYNRKEFENFKLSMSIDRDTQFNDLVVILEDIAKKENVKFIKERKGEYSIAK